MTVPVSVAIPSIPERAGLLGEALASIHAQTEPVAEILVRIAPGEVGSPMAPLAVARSRGALLAAATQPWIAPTADDDVYLPHHFETIAPHLDGTAELIYTYCEGVNCQNVNLNDWSTERLLEAFTHSNLLTGTLVVSCDAVRAVGGWDSDFDPETRRFTSTNTEWEDWDLCVRLLRAGARFRCVPEATWEHRHGDWMACTH